jgi:hypothetical protein
MRIPGLICSVLLFAATPVAAQQPLITLAPPPPLIYGPKTVVPANVACTDVPVASHQPAPLHIVAPHGADQREFSYRDAIVVLNGGTPQGLAAGQRFYAKRLLGPRAGEPLSEKVAGAVHTSGWLTVIAADENSALARIDYACDAVMTGDYLEPFAEPELPTNVATPAGSTDFANLGRVLQGTDRHELFGVGDFVLVDRGSAKGLTAGTRVAFYRDRRNGTPLVELGSGIVLEVGAETAKVILDNTRFVVHSDDYWGVRQP